MSVLREYLDGQRCPQGDGARVVYQLRMMRDFNHQLPDDFTSQEEVEQAMEQRIPGPLDRKDAAKAFWRTYKAWLKKSGNLTGSAEKV
jgi:hypothetical protein